MNTKLRASTILASLVFIATALLLAWENAQREIQARDARAHLHDQRGRLEQEIDDADSGLLTSKEPALSGPHLAQLPATTSIDAQTVIAQLALLEKDPTLQALQLKSNRSQTRSKYSPLYRKLHLSGTQISAFEEITAARDEKLQDLAAAAKSLGLKSDAPAIRKFATQAIVAYQSQMKTLLGETAFAELQNYERTSWLRGIVQNIAGTATLANAPFTPAQSERLIEIIANTSPQYLRGGWVDEIDWEIADAQARVILSPKQFEVYSTLEPANSGRFLSQLGATLKTARKADATHPTNR